MDELIHDFDKHFCFRVVVDFRGLSKRVVPDPYPVPRPKEVSFRIGMENKK